MSNEQLEMLGASQARSTDLGASNPHLLRTQDAQYTYKMGPSEDHSYGVVS